MFLALVCVGDLMRMVRASSPKLELNSTTFILSSIMENCPAPMLTSCLCTWPTTPLYCGVMMMVVKQSEIYIEKVENYLKDDDAAEFFFYFFKR